MSGTNSSWSVISSPSESDTNNNINANASEKEYTAVFAPRSHDGAYSSQGVSDSHDIYFGGLLCAGHEVDLEGEVHSSNDERLIVGGSILEHNVQSVTHAHNLNRSESSSVSGSVIFTPSATSGERSLAGDVIARLSASLKKTSLQQESSDVALRTTHHPGSVAISANQENGSVMYNSENITKWLVVESTATVDQVIQELVNRGLVSEPTPAPLSNEVKKQPAASRVVLKDTKPASTLKGVVIEVREVVTDVNLSTFRRFVLTLPKITYKDKPHEGYFMLRQHPSTWYTALHEEGDYYLMALRSLRQIYGSVSATGILYVVLWANVYKSISVESKIWSKVEQLAKERLPKKVNFLVRVTGHTQEVASKLKAQLPYSKRRIVFKGNDFYFAIKQGEFMLLDHDAATELKKELIDLGIKAEGQTFMTF
ncbi:hypothetical protein L207DRAFT_536829 [Hyaloscypha variabilis F]|uniref:Uncharacterized protein n=1 Tax=Hyaloscypha variabilis (strain UAMH 11265 / GT02V1 / F) TaxID=1149755 RepID=A0A2J6R032_HYAVF|nr:hypothetical protein L207DRAFT_536829 [Hyaloscypha variabilis F]